MSDIGARSRLLSVIDVLEHEGGALAALHDERLTDALRAIERVKGELVAAVA